MAGKVVRTPLVMVATVGEYAQPSSERGYMHHADLIDVVMPAHGGILQGDGTWLQEDYKLSSPFTHVLPDLAHSAGHEYRPIVAMEPTNDSRRFLDHPELWEPACDTLLNLALCGRFDSPWDGIVYDFDTFFDEYNQKHEQFLYILSASVRAEGLLFEIPFHAVTPGTESSQIGLGVIAQVADIIDYYIYIWHEAPYPISPWWWAVESIENAIAHGVPPARIYLGLASYCRHVPCAGEAFAPFCIYPQAIEYVHRANARIEWVENHEIGLVREKYADLGDGHIWITDGDTLRPRLQLVDKYDLAGIMLFCPGMGDESVWQVIADWKQPAAPASKPTDFFTVAPIGAAEVMN